MGRTAWFLIVVCALSCGSAWAEVTFFDTYVYGGPGHTPWGQIWGHFEDGTLEAGTYKPYDPYAISGMIDTSPLSNDIQRDLDYSGGGGTTHMPAARWVFSTPPPTPTSSHCPKGGGSGGLDKGQEQLASLSITGRFRCIGSTRELRTALICFLTRSTSQYTTGTRAEP